MMIIYLEIIKYALWYIITIYGDHNNVDDIPRDHLYNIISDIITIFCDRNNDDDTRIYHLYYDLWYIITIYDHNNADDIHISEVIYVWSLIYHHYLWWSQSLIYHHYLFYGVIQSCEYNQCCK